MLFSMYLQWVLSVFCGYLTMRKRAEFIVNVRCERVWPLFYQNPLDSVNFTCLDVFTNSRQVTRQPVLVVAETWT